MALQDIVDDIRAMRIRGAAPIATAAAKALAEHVTKAQGDQGEVQAATRQAARALLASRPTAVSLRHAVLQVAAPALKATSAKLARDAAAKAAATFVQDVKRSEEAIASTGALMLRPAERILTHCHSSTVVALLAKAHETGKDLHVYATETRPFGQGLTTAKWLAQAGITTTLIVDSAALHMLRTESIDRVLVGADTVTKEGSLYNKVGTSLMALAARSEEVPFWSAASWIKFTPQQPEEIPVEERDEAEVVGDDRRPEGVAVRNPVFDRTPPEHIAGFVTEEGPQKPADAVRRALKRLPKEVAL
jgi:ribose 1,5-bisphosphate isomerase